MYSGERSPKKFSRYIQTPIKRIIENSLAISRRSISSRKSSYPSEDDLNISIDSNEICKTKEDV
jgi:hypothetical protein